MMEGDTFEWDQYINILLSLKSNLDRISLTFGEQTDPVAVPPIIKVSVLMLDKMIEHQGRHNILVFPERSQSIFLFTLVKLLHNIEAGKISRAYDPASFRVGEKLKFGNAVVEFGGIEEHDSKKMMRIRVADLSDVAPIEFFPLFQRTNTQRRLSPYRQYAVERKKASEKLQNLSPDEQYLKLLSDYRTHMESSIVNMTTTINAKEMLSGCRLNGKRIEDLLFVGQADFKGDIRSVNAGQLGGVPAIVLSSDLYSIVAMAEQNHPIQSIIIDGSNISTLPGQIDALDRLMRSDVPIVCVTDTVNSFNLQPLLDRDFNLWRWDETSITPQLYNVSQLNSDKKILNCIRHKIEYIVSDGNEISRAIRTLYTRRNETKELSAGMLRIFDKLFSLAFAALRQTVPFSEEEIGQARHVLEDCSACLATEKRFLDAKIFADYYEVISCLKKIFSRNYPLPKQTALADLFLKSTHEKVCIIVPERSDRSSVESYWCDFCQRNSVGISIQVLHPSEYYPQQCNTFSLTIVVGWLKRAIMRKIIYSFNTDDYVVLLYDYEKRWKNYDAKKWDAVLKSSHNQQTVMKSFVTDRIPISTKRFEPAVEVSPPDLPDKDEFEEIEITLRENRYRQYTALGGVKSVSETVDAIPVYYVGGYLAFYKPTHKVISATNIILNGADKIETILPEQLNLGSFVVVRDTDKDIIKEMADNILAKNNKSDMREISGKWREALQIETLFYTDDEVYDHLKQAGCTKEFPTVRGWLHDDDMIAPQNKQDLECIAAATESKVLAEILDQVYNAAQIVKTAHTKAGRVLSSQLRSRVVEALSEYGEIDPFNIWEPIEMYVDGIGTVRILKIIDIGAPVVVDISDTNRLIEE